MVFTTGEICNNENLICDTLRVNTECELKTITTDRIVTNEFVGDSVTVRIVKGREDANGGGRIQLSTVENAKNLIALPNLPTAETEAGANEIYVRTVTLPGDTSTSQVLCIK